MPPDPENLGAQLFEGLIDMQGDIIHYKANGELTSGKAKHVNPDYRAYLDRVAEYAAMYPANDPHTWVPLARANITRNAEHVMKLMEADAQRLANEGYSGTPMGGLEGYVSSWRKNGATRTEAAAAAGIAGSTEMSAASLQTQDEPEAPDDDNDFGWFGDIVDTVTTPAQMVAEQYISPALEGSGEVADVAYDLGDKAGLAGEEDSAVSWASQTDAYDAFKGAVREGFGAASMPFEAIPSYLASAATDIEEGDYKQLLLHSMATNPIIEAAFVGLENATGTQFYRRGKELPTIWGQTTYGQVILDRAGQGRGEQTGAYDDPTGLQANLGDGFVITREGENLDPGTAESDATTIAQWQRQTRLRANTIVDETVVTDQNLVLPGDSMLDPNGGNANFGGQRPTAEQLNKTYLKIANRSGTDAAIEFAAALGMTWDETEAALTYPAQGFTYGRFMASQFTDPFTVQYNTMSGIGDFALNILDPVNYVPGGGVRAAGRTLLRGGQIIRAGEAGYQLTRVPKIAMSAKDATYLLRQGRSAVDIAPTGAKVLVTDRKTGKVIMDGADIDREALSVQEILKIGKISVEADPSYKTVRTTQELSDTFGEGTVLMDWITNKTPAPKATSNKLLDGMLRIRGGQRATSAARVQEIYSGARVVVRDRDTGRIIANAADIDADNLSPKELRQLGDLRLERVDLDVEPEMLPILDEPMQTVLQNPWLHNNAPGTPGLDAAYGGTYATERAMNWLNSGHGAAVVDGLVAETSPTTIMRKSGYKFDNYLANALARARTRAEVIETLAPRLGAEVKYVRDLQRFSTKTPGWHLGQAASKVLDMGRWADAWKAHVPGQEFMPHEIAHADNPGEVLLHFQRFGRVAVTGHDNNAYLVEGADLMSRALAMRPGRSQQATVYQAIYGSKADNVLMDENGDILMSGYQVQAYLDEAIAEGISKERAIDNLVYDTPGAVEVGEHGVDGYLSRVARVLVEEQGVDARVADDITQAWRLGEQYSRLTAKGADGEDFLDFEGNPIHQPWSDSDLLGRTFVIPDARRMRGAVTHYGKIAHKVTEYMKKHGRETEALDIGREVADEWLSATVRFWKESVLMVGGLRLPVYTSKQVLDTGLTITFNGGISVLHRPMDLVGLLLTSEIRRILRTKSGKETIRGRLARKAVDNPIGRFAFPGDRMRTGWVQPFSRITSPRGDAPVTAMPTGDEFGTTVQKLIDGDPSAHDLGSTDVLNHLTGGGRGGQGQDVLYGQAARNLRTFHKADKKEYGKYREQMAGELYRLSRSQIARRVLSSRYDVEKVADWMLTHRDANGLTMVETLAMSNRKLAAQFRTRQGVIDYLGDRRKYIEELTGGSEELKDVIRHRGKMRVTNPDGTYSRIPILVGNRVTAERKLSKEFKRLFTIVDNTDGINLPISRQAYVSDTSIGRAGYNQYMQSLFHRAGLWEDIYAREPFYRSRMNDHIMDLAPMMFRKEREAFADRLEHLGSPKTAAKLRAMTDTGVLSREDIQRVAVSRAEKDVMEVAYNAANRREWAYAARILAPFVQAAVNGMYRWSMALAKNPESTYRVLRAQEFLQSRDSSFISDYTMSGGVMGDPFIYEDNNGQLRVAIPASGIFVQGIMKMLGQGDAYDNQNLSIGIGGLNLAAPNLSNVLAEGERVSGKITPGDFALGMFPGVGPMVTLPASFASDGTGDISRWLLPYGVQKDNAASMILDAFMPGTLSNLADAMAMSNEEQALNAQRIAVLQTIIAQRKGYDLTDPVEFRESWEEAKESAQVLRLIQAFGAFGSPLPTKVEDIYTSPAVVPERMLYIQEMSNIYREYLDANPGDFGKAEAEFVRDMGTDALAWIASSGENSDVAPPTNATWDLFNKNRKAYDRYSSVLAPLLTDGSVIANDFNSRMWGYQTTSKERTKWSDLDKAAEDVRNDLLDFFYWNRLTEIEEANMPDWMETMAKKDLYDELIFEKDWRGVQLNSPAQYDIDAKLMMEASVDPDMTEVIGAEAQENLNIYLTARLKVRDMIASNNESMGQISSSTSAPEREALFLLGETMALEDPRFSHIWWASLRREVEPEADPAVEGAA
jgi:hypothetical protein